MTNILLSSPRPPAPSLAIHVSAHSCWQLRPDLVKVPSAASWKSVVWFGLGYFPTEKRHTHSSTPNTRNPEKTIPVTKLLGWANPLMLTLPDDSNLFSFHLSNRHPPRNFDDGRQRSTGVLDWLFLFTTFHTEQEMTGYLCPPVFIRFDAARPVVAFMAYHGQCSPT